MLNRGWKRDSNNYLHIKLVNIDEIPEYTKI